MFGCAEETQPREEARGKNQTQSNIGQGDPTTAWNLVSGVGLAGSGEQGGRGTWSVACSTGDSRVCLTPAREALHEDEDCPQCCDWSCSRSRHVACAVISSSVVD